MQIVINVDEKIYNEYMNLATGRIPTYKACDIAWVLKNGTPLPKGRGRLIDENKLLENLKESANHHANNSREESLLYRDRVIVREQPTIIEADEIESEEVE